MDFSYLSKIGDREVNEDYIEVFSLDEKNIFILADGLGGHGCGEVASREAVDCVKRTFLENKTERVERVVSLSVEKAHERLKQMQREMMDESLFKTTLVILVVGEDYIIWSYIGDSRIYHFEGNTLIERSLDHSVPQMLAKSGVIKDKNIRYHEDRNRLLKVLGSDYDNSKPYINNIEPRNERASFLLCTDGFWEHIDEKNIVKSLKNTRSSSEWLEMMEKRILKKARNINKDNYSAIAIRL